MKSSEIGLCPHLDCSWNCGRKDVTVVKKKKKGFVMGSFTDISFLPGSGTPSLGHAPKMYSYECVHGY